MCGRRCKHTLSPCRLCTRVGQQHHDARASHMPRQWSTRRTTCMTGQPRDYGLQTRLIHEAQAANDTAAVSPPIFQTSTYLLRTPEEGADLATAVAPATYYTRYGSPNTKQA